MSLPSIVAPEYTCVIPSTNKEISFRPFLVKEEKILLMAQESGEMEEQIRAIPTVLANCITTPDIAVGSLATFDIEYLFLKIRAKSVGEIVELSVGHTGAFEPSGTLEPSCDHKTKISLNLDEIAIPSPIRDNKIQLTDDVGDVLRFPNFQDVAITDEQTPEVLFNILVETVEYVYDNENVYNEFTKDEMKSWLENLGQSEFEQINNFFQTTPTLKHKIEWTCEACGKDDFIELEGLQSFFI